jgi:hypothetical protein
MTKAQIKVSLKYWRARKAKALRGIQRNTSAKALRKWKDVLAHANQVIKRREEQLHALRPLRERAYDAAACLIGVMESGGNNTGPMVDKIIRDAGGTIGQPWCGYFMFYVYKIAGSKAIGTSAVGRLAYVPWISRLVGKGFHMIPRSRWQKVRRGDGIRFEFTGDGVDDHTGMFVRWVVPGQVMETIEGNTGATGAVSDSSTGGDGVYRKRNRTISQVHDFYRIWK